MLTCCVLQRYRMHILSLSLLKPWRCFFCLLCAIVHVCVSNLLNLFLSKRCAGMQKMQRNAFPLHSSRGRQQTN